LQNGKAKLTVAGYAFYGTFLVLSDSPIQNIFPARLLFNTGKIFRDVGKFIRWMSFPMKLFSMFVEILTLLNLCCSKQLSIT